VDLRAEPMVLSVPAVEKERYYSVMLCDGNTFNYGYIGSRATGCDPGDYMVVGPDWNGETPAGIKKVFRSSTQFSAVAYRTQLFGPDDMPNVEKVQAGYKVQPLSAYLHQPAPPPAPEINFPPIDKDMIKTNFFQYLDFALQFAPPGPEEKAIRAQLARIGVGAGKPFSFDALDLEHKLVIGLGMKEGEKKVDEKIATIGKDVNGWRVASAFGDRDFFHGDWLLRAAAAKAGIYGNDAAEATYPMTKWLPDGEPLDGSKHNYTLTFAAGQLPPVNAFWSVTMYDGKTQLLIENPINRYLINSPMLPRLKRDAGGKVTISGEGSGIEQAADSGRSILGDSQAILAEARSVGRTLEAAPAGACQRCKPGRVKAKRRGGPGDGRELCPRRVRSLFRRHGQARRVR